MLPRHHIFFGFFFILLFYLISPNFSFLEMGIIFLSSILIDVDHVLYYFFKTRSLNPFKAHSWYLIKLKSLHKLSREQRKKIYSGFYLFHGIEWLILFFFLGNYISFFYLILIGFSFHLILDTIHEIYDKGTVDKISLIWNYFRFRRAKEI